MLSKNAFTYSNWDITEYPCRLQDMSRFQGVHIKGFYCTCLQFNVLHGSCAEGLHFSALVIIVLTYIQQSLFLLIACLKLMKQQNMEEL